MADATITTQEVALYDSNDNPLDSQLDSTAKRGIVVVDNDSQIRLGSLTETAPATDTASSGLNGRLQRIAQRLTSLIALLPASLGQKTSANSLAVVLPSDYTLPVSSNNLWQTETNNGKGYVVTTNNITMANGNENPFFLFKNPNASGKTVRVKTLTFWSDEDAANKGTVYRVYRNPTITTNGTALTVGKLKTSGGASISTPFKSPTISANGTLIFSNEYKTENSDTQDFDLGLFIEQNENVLITIQVQSNKDHGCSMTWIEV